MAARKPQNVVEIDGIKIKVDSGYLGSWDGVRQAVEMQRLAADDEASNEDKFMAVFDYYNNAIENLEEVVDALRGGSTPIEDVFAICSKALAGSSAKN